MKLRGVPDFFFRTLLESEKSEVIRILRQCVDALIYRARILSRAAEPGYCLDELCPALNATQPAPPSPCATAPKPTGDRT